MSVELDANGKYELTDSDKGAIIDLLRGYESHCENVGRDESADICRELMAKVAYSRD